ncbi:MAG: ComF family protein [Verrucomicrobiaceae bacterium]|nr:MAG: ComF family protein [Verrucomicrobiaceae bacterium]
MTHPRQNATAGGWGRLLQKPLHTLLDLVYPPRCAACAVRLTDSGDAGTDFCPGCAAELMPVKSPFCAVCGEPFAGGMPAPFKCPNCAGLRFDFDFAISAWLSTGPLREAVHRFKYQRCLHLRAALARRLHDAVADSRLAGMHAPDAAERWCVVPVPLHSRRQRERGFNQSAELARLLARATGLPFLDLLRRSRYTTAQARLDRKERLANLAGAFRPARQAMRYLQGKNVLLIDDVFTTGSTTHECAAVLKKSSQAARVIVLTVARG